MVTPSDRLRRILSDAAPPAVPRASQAPSRGTPASRSLRERLAALRLDHAPGAKPPRGDEGRTWDGADDDRPLDVQVKGAVRETPLGSFLYVERRLPLDALHGQVHLGGALAHTARLRPREAGPAGLLELSPRDAIFLDTETTGLSGGTGTVAFLVGTGQVVDDAFLVRQYCMRDYPEEGPLLHALLEDLGDAPLVTFNGRPFDWPLLTTRWSMHRMRPCPRAHLDLLPLSRRLWVDSVPSHTLATLEEHVLGLKRENDLPGWRIPQAYFDFLRTGRPGLVALAFRHNEIDVVSMLALLGRIGEVLVDPTARRQATPRDLHGTARLLLDHGNARGARACLEEGIARSETSDAVKLRRELGHLLRRQGSFDEALAEWIALARTAPTFHAEAFEQVAKIHEHRRRDYGAALRWVDEALLHVPGGSRTAEAFLHRRLRLTRRIEAGQPA